jgi:hypothetical protein
VVREVAEELTTGEGGDVDVVAEDGAVGGRRRERHLGERRVERGNVDDGVALLPEAERAEEAGNLDIGVRRPDTDVVTVLVGEARAVDIELDVHAVPVVRLLEELVGVRNRGRVRVLRVVDAARLRKRTSRKLACVAGQSDMQSARGSNN